MRYTGHMIKTFRHKGLERFYREGSKAGIQPAHADKLTLQLFTLNRAKAPEDMGVVSGWKLHPLTSKKKNDPLAGHWAVWVSGNWRLTFTFEDGDAILVNYLDYHRD